MAQSLARVLLHLVFSTKNRMPLIPENVEPELYAYMGGIFRDLKCPLLDGNGTTDHVRLLFCPARTIDIAEVVEKVKSGSSQWMKTQGKLLEGFQWQAGYGVFSVSPCNLDEVRAYLARQKEHHQTKTFKEEYLHFLRSYGIPYDERYLWD
jgi:REP element-mobilizing transposase RayT